MSEFGKLIRQLRKKKGYVLEFVAKKIGTHKGYLSGIENGKVKPPSTRLIRRMAKLYNINDKELLKVATLEKIPDVIRYEFEKALASPHVAEIKSTTLFPMISIPLLNTLATRYPVQITPDGAPLLLTNCRLTLPKLDTEVNYALFVCDDQMESRKPLSFSRGDILLLATTASFENHDVVFIIRTSNGGSVAQIREIVFEKNKNIELHPWNAKYPSETISWDDVDLMLKVEKHCTSIEKRKNLAGMHNTQEST